MMRIGRAAFLALVLFVAIGSSATAGGVSPEKLVKAGWLCENIEGQVHCFPPGDSSSSASISVRVFDTPDPGAAEADFLGTELVIRADLFAGQPCPQDGGAYAPLDFTGDGQPEYYACHRYDTSA